MIINMAMTHNFEVMSDNFHAVESVH